MSSICEILTLVLSGDSIKYDSNAWCYTPMDLTQGH